MAGHPRQPGPTGFWSVLNLASDTNHSCPKLASAACLASGVCVGAGPDATRHVGRDRNIDHSSRASGIITLSL